MKIELEIDEHKGVGPLSGVYDHESVLLLVPDGETAAELFACLNCGYTAHDTRMFMRAECDREENHINETVLERYEHRTDN